MKALKCEKCGETTPGYNAVNYGSENLGFRLLGMRCFNGEVAAIHGVEGFENVPLQPVGISDFSGKEHTFHFSTRLLGTEVFMDAFELRDGVPAGYSFQIAGEADADIFALLGRLIQRIRKGLSVQQVENGTLGYQFTQHTIRGRIEWDEGEGGRVPLMIVDGQEFTWDEFGEMLLANEGFQFKLQIIDPSEEA